MEVQPVEESYYSLTDIGQAVGKFFRYVFKHWVYFLLVLGLGVALGVVFYYRQKPVYQAESTFILEEKSSMGGGLSGIASQFGIDMGAMNGSGNLFAGDNILDILKSKKIIRKVLLTSVGKDGATPNLTLADMFLDLSGWRKNLDRKEGLKEISFTNVVDVQSLNVHQDSVLSEIHEFIIKKALVVDRYNKKGSIIRVTVSGSDPTFARLLTNRLVEEAARLYLDIKTGTAQANIDKLQRRSDSLLMLLNRKSYTSASAVPLDINPGIQTAVVPAEIASRDKTLLATLYAEVTKNLEASKLILSQQTPIFQMLDQPGISLKDKRKSLSFSVFGFVVASCFIYILLSLFVFVFKGIYKEGAK